MEITKEHTQLFFNKAGDIQSMDIEYKNGEVISGFPTRTAPSPLRMTFQEHEVPRGQSGKRNIDFEEVERITITFNDGSQQTIE